jgi:hypothetical protein
MAATKKSANIVEVLLEALEGFQRGNLGRLIDPSTAS